MRRLLPACCVLALAWAPALAGADYEQQEQLAQEDFQEAEHHAESHGGNLHFDQIDWLDMAGFFLNFGLLVVLLAWVIRKQGNPALKARRAEIEKELAEAQRLRAEAEAKHAETAQRLEKLDEEMARIRADMVRAGEAERDRIVSQAEEKAARLRKDVSFRIEQQLKQLRKELTEQAATAAVDAAHQLLEERTTEADQDQLAEAYLSRLNQVIQERSS